eukprot:14536-Hanusia_phi.AAC.3
MGRGEGMGEGRLRRREGTEGEGEGVEGQRWMGGRDLVSLVTVSSSGLSCQVGRLMTKGEPVQAANDRSNMRGFHSMARVKNKQPAPVQITAEQILREAKERQEEDPKPPKQKITDPDELADYRSAAASRPSRVTLLAASARGRSLKMASAAIATPSRCGSSMPCGRRRSWSSTGREVCGSELWKSVRPCWNVTDRVTRHGRLAQRHDLVEVRRNGDETPKHQ